VPQRRVRVAALDDLGSHVDARFAHLSECGGRDGDFSCTISLSCARGGTMDDRQALSELNERFIEAFRQGSWELLEPILAPSFSYLDGASGEV
jgi:hypothetical protein